MTRQLGRGLAAAWPSGVDWAEWPKSLTLALPALAASALFVMRTGGWVPGLDEPRFALVGLGLLGLLGVGAWGARRLDTAFEAAWLTTGAVLGLTIPGLALHLALLPRALSDPAPIVSAPALLALVLAGAGSAVAAGLLLVRRVPLEDLGGGLLAAGLPLVLPVFRPVPEQPQQVWALLALSLGLGGLGWLVSGLVRGWPSPLALAAVAAVGWAFAAGRPEVALAERQSGLGVLATAQLAAAVAGTALPLLLPVSLVGWRVWQFRRASKPEPRPELVAAGAAAAGAPPAAVEPLATPVLATEGSAPEPADTEPVNATAAPGAAVTAADGAPPGAEGSAES